MTIMDWLENAKHDIGSQDIARDLKASNQLENAINLLAKGYSVYTNVDELFSRYGKRSDWWQEFMWTELLSVDHIPPREEKNTQC